MCPHKPLITWQCGALVFVGQFRCSVVIVFGRSIPKESPAEKSASWAAPSAPQSSAAVAVSTVALAEKLQDGLRVCKIESCRKKKYVLYPCIPDLDSFYLEGEIKVIVF